MVNTLDNSLALCKYNRKTKGRLSKESDDQLKTYMNLNMTLQYKVVSCKIFFNFTLSLNHQIKKLYDKKC